MRDLALWASGALLAFFVTAGAFLMLANLATGSSEENLEPNESRGRPGPTLDIDINRDRLASLEAAPGQELRLTVENDGDSDFSNVNLTLDVSSGNTALPQTRHYRTTVAGLPAGRSRDVSFPLDLSNTPTTTASAPATVEEQEKILEIRATTPEGITAVRTAILPL